MATPIPENSATFTLADIATATGARLTGNGGCVVRGITTDSRLPATNKLFVALSGERFDGHAFLSEVVEAGARAVLVKREPVLELPVPTLKVDSTARALLTLQSIIDIVGAERLLPSPDRQAKQPLEWHARRYSKRPTQAKFLQHLEISTTK